MKLLLLDIAQTSVALFIIIDPLGGIPVFAGLLRGQDRLGQRRAVGLAVLVALIILIGFAALGTSVLSLFAVGIDEMTIAGGLMLLIIGLDVVFGFLPQHATEKRDVSIVPMACPLLAGPGAITTVMMTMHAQPFPRNYIVAFASVVVTLGVTWAILAQLDRLNRLLGERGSLVLGKVMGIILTSIAVSFILRGIEGFVAQV